MHVLMAADVDEFSADACLRSRLSARLPVRAANQFFQRAWGANAIQGVPWGYPALDWPRNALSDVHGGVESLDMPIALSILKAGQQRTDTSTPDATAAAMYKPHCPSFKLR